MMRWRRGARVIAIGLWVLLAVAHAQDDTTKVTITLAASGVQAWRVTAVDGADDIVDLDTDNPTLTLLVGVRYRFDVSNVNSSFHPLDFRDAEGNILLAQGVRPPGSFDDDLNVNVEEDSDHVSFTLTETLADELAAILCTTHPAMRITVEVDDAVEDEAAPANEDY